MNAKNGKYNKQTDSHSIRKGMSTNENYSHISKLIVKSILMKLQTSGLLKLSPPWQNNLEVEGGSEIVIGRVTNDYLIFF